MRDTYENLSKAPGPLPAALQARVLHWAITSDHAPTLVRLLQRDDLDPGVEAAVLASNNERVVVSWLRSGIASPALAALRAGDNRTAVRVALAGHAGLEQHVYRALGEVGEGRVLDALATNEQVEDATLAGALLAAVARSPRELAMMLTHFPGVRAGLRRCEGAQRKIVTALSSALPVASVAGLVGDLPCLSPQEYQDLVTGYCADPGPETSFDRAARLMVSPHADQQVWSAILAATEARCGPGTNAAGCLQQEVSKLRDHPDRRAGAPDELQREVDQAGPQQLTELARTTILAGDARHARLLIARDDLPLEAAQLLRQPLSEHASLHVVIRDRLSAATGELHVDAQLAMLCGLPELELLLDIHGRAAAVELGALCVARAPGSDAIVLQTVLTRRGYLGVLPAGRLAGASRTCPQAVIDAYEAALGDDEGAYEVAEALAAEFVGNVDELLVAARALAS